MNIFGDRNLTAQQRADKAHRKAQKRARRQAQKDNLAKRKAAAAARKRRKGK